MATANLRVHPILRPLGESALKESIRLILATLGIALVTVVLDWRARK